MEKFDLTKILKVGDRVYTPLYGNGTVKSIDTTSPYPIRVKFGNNVATPIYFTAYGFLPRC